MLCDSLEGGDGVGGGGGVQEGGDTGILMADSHCCIKSQRKYYKKELSSS